MVTLKPFYKLEAFLAMPPDTLLKGVAAKPIIFLDKNQHRIYSRLNSVSVFKLNLLFLCRAENKPEHDLAFSLQFSL